MTRTSVVIDNYNNGPFLRACVDSALDQTLPADEVIVYDDGSTDDSVAILRAFGSRITLIEGVRTGLPSRAAQARAVYEAFLKSSGEFIFLLDGDDRFHPEKIARYAQAFEASPGAVLVQAPLMEIDANGAALGTNYDSRKHQDDYLAATYRLHDVDFYYPTSALAFSRRFLETVLPLDFSDEVELPIDTRLGIVAPLFGKVISIETPLSDWRRHPRSYTAQSRKDKSKLQARETLKRTRVFNTFCRQHGFQPIRVWRNRRFYLQLLRATAPQFLYVLYYNHLRSKTRALPSRRHPAEKADSPLS